MSRKFRGRGCSKILEKMGRAVRKSENAKGVPMLFAEPRRATRMANMGDYADIDAENVESAEVVCPQCRAACGADSAWYACVH